MKALYILMLTLVLGFGAQAQIRTLYYSKQWEIVPKEEAFYYRICVLDSPRGNSLSNGRWFTGNVKDYTNDGKLVMTGSYTIGGLRTGEFIFYYPSGQIQAQGKFINGLRNGIWEYFYENGNLEREVRFTDTNFEPVSAYDSSGITLIKDGTGRWHYEYDWYGEPYLFIIDGNFQDGKMEGVWTCSLSNGQLLYREVYKKNKFKDGIIIVSEKQKPLQQPFNNKFSLSYKFQLTEQFVYRNSTKREHYPFLPFLPDPSKLHDANTEPKRDFIKQDTTTNDNVIFYVVEQPAEFPGGNRKLMEFITKNLTYPPAAKNMGVEGKVFVKFIVDKDGSISNIEIVKGVNEDLDNEAIRLVKKFPKWSPGMQNGKAVKSQFVFPLYFRLGQ